MGAWQGVAGRRVWKDLLALLPPAVPCAFALCFNSSRAVAQLESQADLSSIPAARLTQCVTLDKAERLHLSENVI